jgi:diaminohydroxyphosphoribosylaminopyrimidine deaminase/5-amino-6-(5-phosphoribosylamino)uracil reductase
MVNQDEYFMQKALDAAWAHQGLTFPNPAVGAVITDKNSQIISIGAHEKAGFAHAEVNAIKEAYLSLTADTTIKNLTNSHQIHEYLLKNHNGIFQDKSIYVTLEPCNHIGKTPSCANLIKELGFQRVVIGTKDCDVDASGGIKTLQKANLHVDIGVLKKECEDLLYPFVTWQKKPFVFFKIAMHKNGVIDGGIVTCKESRKHVHALRDKIDLLVIGGNTVRTDRPTLDARLIAGHAPDVLIYSKNKDFDKDIPLFKVANRKVFIEDNLEKIYEYKFVMIEGGVSMYESIKEQIDWVLIYTSPHEKVGKKFLLEKNLQHLFTTNICEDKLTWYKR